MLASGWPNRCVCVVRLIFTSVLQNSLILCILRLLLYQIISTVALYYFGDVSKLSEFK